MPAIYAMEKGFRLLEKGLQRLRAWNKSHGFVVTFCIWAGIAYLIWG